MFGYSKIKIIAICCVVALGVFFSAPNFMPARVYNDLPRSMRSWYHPVTLGLDLQGGSYLVMEVQTDTLIAEKLESLADLTRSALRESKIKFSGLTVRDGQMSVKILKGEQLVNAKSVIHKQESLPLDIQTSGNTLTISYTPEALETMKSQAVDQSLQIVRTRIDELGTKEPQIQRQGLDRIVIQLPGVQDPSEIKALMGRTAKMTFHLVDEETPIQSAQAGKMPADSMLATSDETGYVVLKRAVVVGGESLDDARGSYDDQGRPAVSFSFKAAGAKKFARATRENIGRRLAIVLDGNVISAPTIQSAIPNGQGIITGSFTVQETNNLALLLRSGALPAPLIVVEERVVGPGLGEDSIHAGTIACVIGLALVLIFMIVVYGFFGIIADLTLIANGILLFALLSLMGATLTLPGLAGIALTVGMAVDANVLIYERMKEEVARGVTVPTEVITRGYAGSFGAIFDGQLTTLFAALFLFWLGSGPVRGFGVTLGLGLMTTLFSAILVSKVLLIAWVKQKNPKKINL